MNQPEISKQDREILRDLARRQAGLAASDVNRERIALWYDHNDGHGSRPMIHLELGTFAHEVISPLLRCSTHAARQIEMNLYNNFANQEFFDDDRVTPDYYPVCYDSDFRLFNLDVKVEHTSDADGNTSLGHHFVSQITDLEEDYPKLQATRYEASAGTLADKIAFLTDLFGDILPVRPEMGCLYCVPTQYLLHIMSMETMMYSLYDYPDLFRKMMNRIAEDTNAYYRMLEKKGLIWPTVGHNPLGQGSWCYTRELPGEEEAKKRPLTTRDVWGFLDSQETVGISPEMYEEFIFPCYREIAPNYRRLSYGCCEPVHPIWKNCLSKLPNLRKLSISPWCDEAYMGEQLRGTNIIYHRKPSPNFLGVGATLDEDAFRDHIRATVRAAKGCKLEITQRDVYTINHDISKARRFVQIIREETEDAYSLT